MAGTALECGQILHAFVEKACLRLMKIFIKVQSSHPYSFSNKNVLLLVFVFCYIQITKPLEENVPFQTIFVNHMIFLQNEENSMTSK